MLLSSILMLIQAESRYVQPTWFIPVAGLMLAAGVVTWLIAAVLGFARARAFGPSTRWFAFAAVCMIIYHLQFLLIALGLILENPGMTLAVGAFFNLFAVLAALCSTMGFIRLTNPR
ncbi:MAG TPA: hypothetical protein VGN86_01380 [Pyrinomonadaceae bacterium]|jgi:hypothetical protein|nr:hypothetical protein [Pyrinomonadaceae bacterium]